MEEGPTQGEGPTPSPTDDALAQTLAKERREQTRPSSELAEGDTVQIQSERIGRYRLVAPLGAGGMGLVHLAHDDDLDRSVALKVLRPGGSGDPRRLLREARSMARLSHPHIAAVHDVGTHEGDVYVAMEYVEGPTLRAWMDGAHDWEEQRQVLLQAARGLAAAHDHGVVHRDFKPENVIVGSDGRVRVLDFGLAKLAPRTSTATEDSTETQVGAIVGTPRYMAPEQLRGQKAGPAADQFAFCVTAYESVFAERPFEGEVFADVAASVLTQSPREPSPDAAVPQGLWPALQRGLAVDPEERHADMNALVEVLEGLAGTPATAAVVSRPALRDAREDARSRLTDAYAGDLLDADELDERLEQLESAVDLPAVAVLVADLAPLPDPAGAAPAVVDGAEAVALAVPASAVPAVVDVPANRTMVALFSGTRRGGAWTPARVNRVFTMFGGAEIDLREALLPSGTIEVQVFAMFGGVTITVTPGTRVLLECTAIMGGADQEDASIAPEPGATVVRVTGFVMFGGVGVVERLPGESGRAARKRRRALRKAKQVKALPPKR